MSSTFGSLVFLAARRVRSFGILDGGSCRCAVSSLFSIFEIATCLRINEQNKRSDDLGTDHFFCRPDSVLAHAPASSSPAEALCTGFDRLSFCQNAGLEQPQLGVTKDRDLTKDRSKPTDCWDALPDRHPVLVISQHAHGNSSYILAESDISASRF